MLKRFSEKRLLDDIFVFIYVLGSKISLPFVDLSKALRLTEGTTTGLQLSPLLWWGNPVGCRSFDRSIPMDVFHDFVADVYRFKTLLTSKNQHEIVERRKMHVTWRSLLSSLGSGHVSPLKTGLKLPTCRHCGQYHGIMVAEPSFSLPLI